MSKALELGAAVFATEWGTCDASGDGTVNLAEAERGNRNEGPVRGGRGGRRVFWWLSNGLFLLIFGPAGFLILVAVAPEGDQLLFGSFGWDWRLEALDGKLAEHHQKLIGKEALFLPFSPPALGIGNHSVGNQ